MIPIWDAAQDIVLSFALVDEAWIFSRSKSPFTVLEEWNVVVTVVWSTKRYNVAATFVSCKKSYDIHATVQIKPYKRTLARKHLFLRSDA